MATLPPESTLPRRPIAQSGEAAPDALEAAWTALHSQAGELATMARIAAEPAPIDPAFSQLIASAHSWQRTLLAQGIEDVVAMLDSGMAALLTLANRGQDTAAPALALWREFHAARGGLLTMLHADRND